MPSPLLRARELLQDTRNYVRKQESFRFYPLYSVLLMSMVWAYSQWPFTERLMQTYRLYYWLVDLKWFSTDAACYCALALGLIGLFRGVLRRDWIAGILSSVGIFFAYRYFFWFSWEQFWINSTYYFFDVPAMWIAQTAGNDPYMQTTLFAVYLLFVWILMRPFLKLAWRRIVHLEETLIAHYPALEKFRQPVM